MLNISSQNPLRENLERYATVQNLSARPHYKILNRIILAVSLFALLVLFLPWTQNVSGSGQVTALRPDQRPQTIQTVIAGQIKKWYVAEGAYVKKGDTIVHIAETKSEYFDPNLIDNTSKQVEAKKRSVESYSRKADAIQSQRNALAYEKNIKLQQANNKIRQAKLKIDTDSIAFEAAKTQLSIAQRQFNRSSDLERQGLKPVTDVEEKRLKLQEAQAKIISAENYWIAAKNEFLNARMERTRIIAEYDEKLSKAESDQQTAISDRLDSEAQASKLESQFNSYSVRNQYYYITAPQDGYVNRALKAGVGETVSEGVPVVTIMPSNYDIAVETFVSPIDLPLLKFGGEIRVWFDGWPTIVFSGWPGVSYGTFGGRIVAIESVISANGKYRVLVAPDKAEPKWPEQIRVGTGVQTVALLDTVPVWFEIWRTLNGFPPNFYNGEKK